MFTHLHLCHKLSLVTNHIGIARRSVLKHLPADGDVREGENGHGQREGDEEDGHRVDALCRLCRPVLATLVKGRLAIVIVVLFSNAVVTLDHRQTECCEPDGDDGQRAARLGPAR